MLKLFVKEKDYEIVSELGAKFSKPNNCWYVPSGKKITDFNRFIPLTIELVPQNNWAFNLRSILNQEQWDTVRRASYKHSNYTCEICGNKASKYFPEIKHPVECHEIWEYIENEHIQRLGGIISLCHDCHRAKHIGKAEIDGVLDEICQHIADVNSWTLKEVNKYIQESFEIWNNRNRHNWKLEIE